MPHGIAPEGVSDNVLAEVQTTVATADEHGVVTGWSEGARRLLGYRSEEVIGQTATWLLAEGGIRATKWYSGARPSWSGKVVLRHLDGHRVEGELLANHRLAEQGGGWILVWGPVRGRHAEDALVCSGFDQAPCALAVFDTDLRVVRANVGMERALGLTNDQMRGLRAPECFPHPEVEKNELLMRHVMETAEQHHRETFLRVPGEPRAHAWRISIAPVRDRTGRVRGACFLAQDVTKEYESRRRLTVLNEAGLRIGTTLDLTRTADELANVATDHFADFVIVDLLDRVLSGDDTERASARDVLACRRVAQRSILPGCPEAVTPIGALHAYPEDSPAGQALATGRALLQLLDDAALRWWAADEPERARSIRNQGIHSAICVPLRARGVTLGLAFFSRHRTPEPFDEQDLRLAEELAARAAVYIDNARRYTRERKIALALQSTLLPDRALQEAAVEVAARYVPADPGADIGGDWFDVIPLSGARVALVVGDVAGRGIQASATMGRLCTAVRTLADVDLAPDELLTQLDDLVLRLDREEASPGGGQAADSAAEVGATCLYAIYDPVSRRCSMARAGHPAPVTATPDGTVESVDLPAGPPLGLGGLPFEVAEFELPEGSVIALYTNGLIQSADRDVDEARDTLRGVLAGPNRPLQETCDEALSILLPDHRSDDAALLLARTQAFGADRVATWELASDPTIVARARELACERLAVWNLEEDAFVIELIVSELVTNAIRYGHPPVQLRLVRDTTLICEVSDASSTAPHLRRARTFDEGGRGLLIVAQLSQRWGSRHTRTGKTIWAEVPFPAAVPSAG